MKANRRIQNAAAVIIVFLVALFFVEIFSMMSKTNNTELYLMDRLSQSYGWSYELLADGKVSEVAPEFLDEYTTILPGDTADAVKITRIFTEEMSAPSLEMIMYGKGVEVFVDGELLYSDFQGGERNEAGFLVLDGGVSGVDETLRSVRISLPDDYVGKEVAIITYFSGDDEDIVPVYPLLVNDQTDYAAILGESVLPIAGLTTYAICAVLLTVMFVLDMRNKKANFSWLLLVLYFMLLFLKEAYDSMAGSVSVLMEHMNLKPFCELYIVPLYIYLIRRLTSWRKFLTSGLLAVWFLYKVTQILINVRRGYFDIIDRSGVGFLLLFVAMGAVVCIEYFCYGNGRKAKSIRKYLPYMSLTMIVVVLRVLCGSAEWNGDVGMHLHNMVFAAAHGSYLAIVNVIADSCAIISVIILLLEFIRRTAQTYELVGALEERSRLAKEGYDRMLEAEEATNSVRHELRHHMTALLGMLQEQETQRACVYISSVMNEMEMLPAFRYSQNMLVNVISGFYLDKAKKLGIKVEYNLLLPQSLGIADEDISVYLTNLLENALEACKRMKADQARYIRIRMQVNGNFLFIECVNSTDGQSEEGSGKEKPDTSEHRIHGFGLKAMGMIAEKYGSVLKIERDSSEFSVRTNLCMKKREVCELQ